MARRDDLLAFLDELLEPALFRDHGPNGLQVPGAAEVHVVATAVSAGAEVFERAAGEGAELVICHHGLFWDGQPRTVSPQLKRRLTLLFDADISLAAYHLPLDAHPEVGNNALICEALGLRREAPFGQHRDRALGFVAAAEGEGIALEELVARCARAFGRPPLVLPGGPDLVRRVGIVSGGGASSLGEAIALGLDALVSGEPSEPGAFDAREGACTLIAGGHHATETFGVRRLGDLLAERFGVEHSFIAVENPV